MATVIKKKKESKKLDEFISTSERLSEAIGNNWQLLCIGLAVLVMTSLIFSYLGSLKTKKRDQMFWEISKIESAPNKNGEMVVGEFEKIVDKYNGVKGVAYAEFSLARHLLTTGDSDKGVKILNEVKKGNPSGLFAQLADLELGYHLEFTGKYAEAAVYYQSIIDGDVLFTKAEAYLGLGRCQEATGKKEDALKTFREFIQKFPGHTSQEFAKIRVRALENGSS